MAGLQQRSTECFLSNKNDQGTFEQAIIIPVLKYMNANVTCDSNE